MPTTRLGIDDIVTRSAMAIWREHFPIYLQTNLLFLLDKKPFLSKLDWVVRDTQRCFQTDQIFIFIFYDLNQSNRWPYRSVCWALNIKSASFFVWPTFVSHWILCSIRSSTSYWEANVGAVVGVEFAIRPGLVGRAERWIAKKRH